MIDQAVAILAPWVGAVIVSLVGYGITRFNAWMQSKVDSERMQAALLQVSEATVSAVMDLEATMRPMLSDGQLTLAEQKQIKAAALNRVNALAPNAIRALASAGMMDMEAYIAGKIEQVVATLPPSSAEATAGTKGT